MEKKNDFTETFDKVGVKFVSKSSFENYKDVSLIQYLVKKRMNDNQRKPLNSWVKALIGKEIKENILPSLEIKKSNDIVGYGVYTKEPLNRYTYLGEYTGCIRQKKFFNPKSNDYSFDYITSLTKTFIMDALSQGNHTRFFNHSTRSNCVSFWYVSEDFQLHIVFMTSRKIEKGEQLLYDYGEKYWKNRPSPLSL